jgi:hypothetical protein
MEDIKSPFQNNIAKKYSVENIFKQLIRVKRLNISFSGIWIKLICLLAALVNSKNHICCRWL